MHIHLHPILINEDPKDPMYANDDCQELFKSYPAYYHTAGYNPPWIGYFVLLDGKPVGMAGFVGKPINNTVEVAYGTFKAHEGKGIASFACSALIDIARANEPSIIITAKTAPEKNASVSILQKNGFVYTGVVQDDGIGDAWHWILEPGKS